MSLQFNSRRRQISDIFLQFEDGYTADIISLTGWFCNPNSMKVIGEMEYARQKHGRVIAKFIVRLKHTYNNGTTNN